MTNDPISHATLPRRSRVTNASGITYPVTGFEAITLSPFLSLSHILLVSSLSNTLISLSQVTVDLNCLVLIYPTFVFLSIFSPRR